jgi:multidrug efflux pump subunit AcrA (membrane-fusion protein)
MFTTPFVVRELSHRRIAGLAFVLAVALAGCDRAGAKPSAQAADVAKRVIVVHPTRQPISRTVTQPAKVFALNEATIYAQVAGYLGSIAVDKGDAVKKGDVLAVIEVPELEAERKQTLAMRRQVQAELKAAQVALDRAESTRLAAEAGLTRAQADTALQKALFERTKDLRADGVVSVQDLEVAEGRFKESQASMTLAQARLKEAEAAKREVESQIDVAAAKIETVSAQIEKIDARLSYSRIRSPLDGIVTHRWVDTGAMIQQATASSTQASPIVTVAEISRVRVDFQVPEVEFAHVAVGQHVWLRADAYPGRTFEGKVTRFAGALDPSTLTMLTEAEYECPDRALRPGMFGAATIELERRDEALTLPAEAVKSQEGKRVLFLVENGVAHRRVVQVGLDSGPTVEVAKGLTGGESVVVGGERLTDGAPVVAVERKTDEQAGKTAEASHPEKAE